MATICPLVRDPCSTYSLFTKVTIDPKTPRGLGNTAEVEPQEHEEVSQACNIFGVTDLHPGLLRKDPYRTLC